MSDDELLAYAAALPGVHVMTADEESGAPEAAWGDSFIYLGVPEGQQMPFATIVVSDYDGFDTASDLNRPGVFRLNVSLGRERFEAELGYPPSSVPDGIDYANLDVLIPHPLYASQSWASIVCPGERTDALARELLTFARDREATRAGR
jgi:hypothetical protein